MSSLPEVRAADCGHGFLAIDAEPSGRARHPVRGWQHVFLCDECRSKLNERQVVTKDVRPAPEPKPTMAATLEQMRVTRVEKNADARSELSEGTLEDLIAQVEAENPDGMARARAETQQRVQQRRRGRPRKS